MSKKTTEGRDPNVVFDGMMRYCAFPDCDWMVARRDVLCHRHNKLVPVNELQAIGSLTANAGDAFENDEYVEACRVLEERLGDVAFGL